jgi:hypothetical protein
MRPRKEMAAHGHVLESLPPGSYLTVSDTVRDIDIDTGRVTEGTARLNQRMGRRS